jgi:hypothetical protein
MCMNVHSLYLCIIFPQPEFRPIYNYDPSMVQNPPHRCSTSCQLGNHLSSSTILNSEITSNIFTDLFYLHQKFIPLFDQCPTSHLKTFHKLCLLTFIPNLYLSISMRGYVTQNSITMKKGCSEAFSRIFSPLSYTLMERKSSNFLCYTLIYISMFFFFSLTLVYFFIFFYNANDAHIYLFCTPSVHTQDTLKQCF